METTEFRGLKINKKIAGYYIIENQSERKFQTEYQAKVHILKLCGEDVSDMFVESIPTYIISKYYKEEHKHFLSKLFNINLKYAIGADVILKMLLRYNEEDIETQIIEQIFFDIFVAKLKDSNYSDKDSLDFLQYRIAICNSKKHVILKGLEIISEFDFYEFGKNHL